MYHSNNIFLIFIWKCYEFLIHKYCKVILCSKLRMYNVKIKWSRLIFGNIYLYFSVFILKLSYNDGMRFFFFWQCLLIIKCTSDLIFFHRNLLSYTRALLLWIFCILLTYNTIESDLKLCLYILIHLQFFIIFLRIFLKID